MGADPFPPISVHCRPTTVARLGSLLAFLEQPMAS